MEFPTRKYTNQLQDKRTLIIGGTSGIGFAVAEAALEHGSIVTIAGSDQAKLGRAVSRLQASYPIQTSKNRLRARACDLGDTASLDSNLTDLLKLAADGGKINHVVFTAARITPPPALEALNVEAIQSEGLIRFVAAMILVKHIPHYMDLVKENSLTLTSGASTQKPDAGWAIVSGYCGAVEAAAKGLALDLKPLRVNVVSPGAVLTEVVRETLKDDYDLAVKAAIAKSTVGAVGQPEEVAQAYLYLMKDHYISGTVLESNGGMLLV